MTGARRGERLYNKSNGKNSSFSLSTGKQLQAGISLGLRLRNAGAKIAQMLSKPRRLEIGARSNVFE
jgi:hypothetical protein